MCSRIRWLDDPFRDSSPDVVRRYVGIRPGDGEEGSIPSHHGGGLFVALEKVVQTGKRTVDVDVTKWTRR